MKRIKTTAKDKALHRRLCQDFATLRDDHRSRLENAIQALSQSDPHFIIWLENIDHSRPAVEIMRTVEARARALVLKNYSNLNRTEIIFSDYPFSERGTLVMG